MGKAIGSKTVMAASLCTGAGMLISPDTLVRLGQFTGYTGLWGMVLLALTMVLFVYLTPGMGRPSVRPASYRTYLTLTVRAVAAVVLPTGVLVSSGFVFNEIFLYWFPNFGFAFLLLFLILAVNMMSVETGLKFQMGAVGIGLGSLLILAIAGLAGAGEGDVAGNHTLLPLPLLPLPVLFFPLLLWVGADITGIVRAGVRPVDTDQADTDQVRKLVGLTIVCGGLIFLTWAVASAFHVSLVKLAGSSIPHLKAARGMLGDTGRYLMGIVVIFGSLAAVNALFLACRLYASSLAREGCLPGFAGNSRGITILLTTAIGLMMVSGMAGSEKLEYWIEAVFVLWMMTYTGIFTGKNNHSHTPPFIRNFISIGGVFLLFHGEGWLLKWGYVFVILGIALLLQIIFSPGSIRTSRPVV
jgi:amino acid transporter